MQATRKPQTFLDLQKREWRLALDFIKLPAIRDSTGVDFGQVEHFSQSWAQLYLEQDKLLKIVWLVVSGQAEAQGITQQQWLESMDDAALGDAYEALGESVVNFTRPQNRGMIEAAINTIKSGVTATMEKASAEIQKQGEKAIAQLMTMPLSAPELLATSTKNGRSAKRQRQ